MEINRRDFLKTAAITGGYLALACTLSSPVEAAQTNITQPDGFAVLTDLTKCVGCRRCEAACNKSNNLPSPKVSFDDPSVFSEKRRTQPEAYTVVNQYYDPKWKRPVYRKTQCNHCAEPACASACPVGALKKSETGAVIYNEDLCIGCRYCITACPFYIPTFEYNDPGHPAIGKCTMCYQRTSQGMKPACVEACSVEALTFSKRSEILKIARDRIRFEPLRYIDHIYGEHEVGGTDWLYISGVPFEGVGLPENLGTTPLPEYTKEFLSFVPLVLVMWPAIFGGIYAWTSRRRQKNESNITNGKREDTHQ
jgi:formate dehydrogenase iron-sulfur subunit